jgi:hypothetical protein
MAAFVPTCENVRTSDAPKARRGPFETSPFPTGGEVSKASPGKSMRGGPRNRASRETDSLSPAQVANLTAAAAHALAIRLPFTRFITIHWESAGIALADMVRATGRFLDLMTKALARHGARTAWLWVHENGEGKGGHLHILIHVPAELVPLVSRLQRGWLRSITGRPYRARVIHSKPIGGRLGLEKGNPDLYVVNLSAALNYVLKGVAPDCSAQLGITRLEPGGRVIGKRCGTSQNIGPKARCNSGSSLAGVKLQTVSNGPGDCSQALCG